MANIEERNGSYRITVSIGRDIYGKKLRERATFTPDPTLSPKKRQKAVEEFAWKFEQEVMNGAAMEGRRTTLRQFVEKWKTDYAAEQLEPGTADDYFQELDQKILPALGHLKLSELRPLNLNSYFISLSKDGARRDGKPGGYSKRSILKTFNVLSSVLRTATEWEIIDRNPCERVRIRIGDSVDKIKFFTPEQAAAFLDYIEKPYIIKTKGHQRIDDTGKPYKVDDYESEHTMPLQHIVLLNLALFAGLRKGELLALQWTDIDFEADTVSVTKSASVAGGKQICKTPKTKSGNRTVSIPHFLTMRLKEWKTAQLRYRLSVGDYWTDNNWIFTQDDGRMMNYSTPYHIFHDALNRYNEGKAERDQLPLIPFHGLRHTSATILIANHADIKTVQNRLGHAEASTTMNIYAHALKETDKKAAFLLENALSKHA